MDKGSRRESSNSSNNSQDISAQNEQRKHNVMEQHRRSVDAMHEKEKMLSKKMMMKFDFDFNNSTLHLENF